MLLRKLALLGKLTLLELLLLVLKPLELVLEEAYLDIHLLVNLLGAIREDVLRLQHLQVDLVEWLLVLLK